MLTTRMLPTAIGVVPRYVNICPTVWSVLLKRTASAAISTDFGFKV